MATFYEVSINVLCVFLLFSFVLKFPPTLCFLVYRSWHFYVRIKNSDAPHHIVFFVILLAIFLSTKCCTQDFVSISASVSCFSKHKILHWRLRFHLSLSLAVFLSTKYCTQDFVSTPASVSCFSKYQILYSGICFHLSLCSSFTLNPE